MPIKVEFKSSLKDITGTQTAILDRSFNTLGKAMAELIRLYPGLEDEMFYADGTIDYAYQVILNNRRLAWPEDSEVKIKDGDRLLFMVFMAGG